MDYYYLYTTLCYPNVIRCTFVVYTRLTKDECVTIYIYIADCESLTLYMHITNCVHPTGVPMWFRITFAQEVNTAPYIRIILICKLWIFLVIWISVSVVAWMVPAQIYVKTNQCKIVQCKLHTKLAMPRTQHGELGICGDYVLVPRLVPTPFAWYGLQPVESDWNCFTNKLARRLPGSHCTAVKLFGLWYRLSQILSNRCDST